MMADMDYSLNAYLGWLLLLAGIAAAVVLDPWSLGERDPRAIVGSTRMAARHAQAVVLAMGFLQLAVSLLLRGSYFRENVLFQWASKTLAVGTLVYTAGYVGHAYRSRAAVLIPLGASINLAGFGLVAWHYWRDPSSAVLIVLAVFLLGMAIDVASGLLALIPKPPRALDLGPEDDVRQRMLRLARVAATALSLLALLFLDLYPESAVEYRWGAPAVLVGTAGMPIILTAASFMHRAFKYLLPIPALAMTAGAVCGFLLAVPEAESRKAPLLEPWGWLLVAASMGVGLLVGLYAFDGPLPTPRFAGAYNAYTRRLTRLGHAYCIAFGMLAIVLARRDIALPAAWCVVSGTVITLLEIALVALSLVPARALAVGPAVLALALLASLLSAKGSAVPGDLRDAAAPRVPRKGGTAFVHPEYQP
jgi:hypothetical protein